ncbi:uncharacterized protein LOC124923988 isoform X2 [Impatiens glandulifera]|nr:uncharacterized protein LOC124923988 isoform X2 [Impatiens glandulifera]
MEKYEETSNITITWRGTKFVVEMNSGVTLRELGLELQKLTEVKGDTMRLIVPQLSTKSSKMFLPFSKEHCNLSLEEASILKGKSVKMMGVPEHEVDEILQSAKESLRIAGFEEEEKRLRQRMLNRPTGPIKLPQGPYIFCDFRTLHIPGLELNPPPSEALKRMHMLAADPGIVAIMNKHHWRVGIMTEMAPEGYVGVSPMCILGFNKNQGEEISLRLRTDDLKGFRKYESIKKTLLHELTHMVHSDHDNKFLALQSQLNHEASTLDWTKSKSHSLSKVSHSIYEEENFMDVQEHNPTGHILGGNSLRQLTDARATSVAAAFGRLATTSLSNLKEEDPEPDATIWKENIDELDDATIWKENIDELDDGANDDSDDITIEAMCSEREPDLDDPIVEEETRDSEPEVETRDLEPVDLPNDSSLTPMEELNPDNDEELQRIQDPVTIFCTRLQMAINMLKSEVSSSELATVQQTLFKIIRNVIEHPNDTKFKRIRKVYFLLYQFKD